MIEAVKAQGLNKITKALRYALALMVILSFTGYYFLPSSQANNFPTYIVAILLVADFCLSNKSYVQKSVAFRCVFVFLLYILLSIGWSQHSASNQISSMLGNVALLLTMILSIERCMRYFPWFGSWLLSALTFCAVVSSLIYLLSSYFDEGNPPGRLSAHSVAAISYGSALVVSAFLIVKTSVLVGRLFWSLCFFILGFACYRLEMDFVWLALVGSVSVIAFSRVWENRDTVLVFGWMALATCLLGAFLYLFDMVLVSNRQMIWESVVNVAYDNNLLIGSGMLTPIMPIVDCDQFPAILNSFSSCNFQHPHNLFVSSLFRGGIIGLALLVLLFLVGISSALESDKDERWLVFAMLSYCAIIFLFDGDHLVAKLDFVWLIFWLPVALAVYLETREAEEGF